MEYSLRPEETLTDFALHENLKASGTKFNAVGKWHNGNFILSANNRVKKIRRGI